MGLKKKSPENINNNACNFRKTAKNQANFSFFKLAALIAVLMVLPILFSCAHSGKENSFLMSDNGRSVTFSPGDVFTVTLESNQTTGYSWKLSENMDKNILLMTASVYKVPESSKDKVGAGGTETFSFKALSEGKTSILLEYLRPWEEGVKPELTFTLNVEIK